MGGDADRVRDRVPCPARVDQFGEEKARALFQDNPLAAFEGRQLPHVPEVEDELPLPRRKRFLFL